MRIIAYRTSINDMKILLEESTSEHLLSNDLNDLLGFLLEDYPDTIRICWDLDDTVSLLLRRMGHTLCAILQKLSLIHI